MVEKLLHVAASMLACSPAFSHVSSTAVPLDRANRIDGREGVSTAAVQLRPLASAPVEVCGIASHPFCGECILHRVGNFERNPTTGEAFTTRGDNNGKAARAVLFRRLGEKQ
ncbi:MAG TPA: hypothetical protein VJM34_04275 [Novosphingobium sp.]|nr:hypothetical protein [Novosphingobium sp.]